MDTGVATGVAIRRIEELHLGAHGAPRRFASGALILVAGAPAKSVFVIRRGCIRTYLIGADGTETTTALLGPGQLVGLAPLLGRPTYHGFAEAQTDVEVWAIWASRLPDALRQSPELWVSLVSALWERLAMTETLLRDVALLPVPERVRNARARLHACFDGAPPRLTREALAGLVAARRETVSRALQPSRRAAA